MSTSYTAPDFALEGKETMLRRMERRTFLQFVLCDWFILGTYFIIVTQLLRRGLPCSRPGSVYNNPYHIDVCQLECIERQIESYLEGNSHRTIHVLKEEEVRAELASIAKMKKKDQKFLEKGIRDLVQFILDKHAGEFEQTKDAVNSEAYRSQVEEIINSEFKGEWQGIEGLDPPGVRSLFEKILDEHIRNVKPTTSIVIQPPKIPPLCSSLTKRISWYAEHDFDWIKYPFPLIMDFFKIHVIFLTVQRLLSYGLVNTQRVYDLKAEQDIAILQRSSNLHGTEDNPNEKGSNYLEEARKVKILGELIEANGGLPIPESIEAVLIEFAFHMGHLSSEKKLIIESEGEGDLVEATNEKELVRVLFPPQSFIGDIEYLFTQPAPHKIEIKKFLSSVIEWSGLGPVIDKIDSYLPNDIFDMQNSEILDNAVKVWGALFSEYQPDILDQLVATLPTIPERFRLSSTTSKSQEDLTNGARRLMEDFLEEALAPIRLSELEVLLNNPSANASLYYFRSLRVLVNQSSGISDSEIYGISANVTKWWTVYPWFHPADQGRIKFLKLIHVALSDPDDQKLGDIFSYAMSLLDDNKLESYFNDIKGIRDKLVPWSMFPGSLEGPDVQLAKGGRLIERNFEREQKNKNILMTRLGRIGGIETVLRDAKLRWYP